jgi:hypothetical protein
MNRTFLIVALVAACALLGTSSAGAEGFGTPTMDGIPDSVYGSAEASDSDTDGGGNENMDLLDLYVCNDASYWYFCFTIDDDIGATDWGKYVIYLDTDGVSGSGAPSDSGSWYRNVWANDPHLPEYGLYSWVDSPPYDPSHTQLWGYSGGTWSGAGEIDDVALNSGVISGIEWKIEKSRIGSPDSLWCEVWSTGGNSGDNARDTSNDPPDDWNGAEGAWQDTAWIDISTLVHYASGEDITHPRVIGAKAVDWTHVDVTFSEAMDSLTATDPANYTVASLTFTGAQKLAADKIRLTSAEQTVFILLYTLTVSSSVTDLAGNGVDPDHDEWVFNGFGVAPVTFVVVDTGDTNYADGYKFKGSWDTNQYHAYDPGWGLGQLYDMYDDGTNGDDMAGDHIWKRTLELVPDAAVNEWKWGITNLSGDQWLGGNWIFQVVDTTPQTLYDQLTGKDVAVIFSVDMSAETVTSPVIICGDTAPLTWTWSPDNPDTLNDEGLNGDETAGDDIWSITITFPSGTDQRAEYKYGNGGVDNDLPYGTNRVFIIDDVTYSVGNPQVLATDTFGILTGIEEWDAATSKLPEGFTLLPNYPNPFNPETAIAYRLSVTEPTAVTLSVFNLLGQRVRTLAEGVQSHGEYQLVWDGRDDDGRSLSSGIYFLRLQVGQMGQTMKLVLVR